VLELRSWRNVAFRTWRCSCSCPSASRASHLTVLMLLPFGQSFAPDGAHAPALRPVALRTWRCSCSGRSVRRTSR